MVNITTETDAAATKPVARAAQDAVSPSEGNPPSPSEARTEVGGKAAEADGGAGGEKDGKKRPVSDIADDTAKEPVAKRASLVKGGPVRAERTKGRGKGETAEIEEAPTPKVSNATTADKDKDDNKPGTRLPVTNIAHKNESEHAKEDVADKEDSGSDAAADDEVTVNKQGFREGKWTEEEHELFLSGMHIFGRSWTKIAKNVVKTRSIAQVRSHAQKYERRLRNEREKIENQLKQEQWYRSSQEHIREARLQNYLTTHVTPAYHHDDTGSGSPAARGMQRDMYPGAERGMYSAEAEASHFYGGYGHPGMRHAMSQYAPPPQHPHHGMMYPYGHHGGMYPNHQQQLSSEQQLGLAGAGASAQGDSGATGSSAMTGGTSGTAAKDVSVEGTSFNAADLNMSAEEIRASMPPFMSNVAGSVPRSMSNGSMSAEVVSASIPQFIGGGGQYPMHGRTGPVQGVGPGYRVPAGPMGGYNGMYTAPTGVTGLPAGINGNTRGSMSFTRPELLMMQQMQQQQQQQQQQQIGRAMGNGYPYQGNGMLAGAGFASAQGMVPSGEVAAKSTVTTATSDASDTA